MEYVKWFVSRDYSETAPGLGTVGCALFNTEADAREYYRWQKRRLATENKKRLYPRAFVWIWGKQTEIIEEDGGIHYEFEVRGG